MTSQWRCDVGFCAFFGRSIYFSFLFIHSPFIISKNFSVGNRNCLWYNTEYNGILIRGRRFGLFLLKVQSFSPNSRNLLRSNARMPPACRHSGRCITTNERWFCLMHQRISDKRYPHGLQTKPLRRSQQCLRHDCRTDRRYA